METFLEVIKSFNKFLHFYKSEGPRESIWFWVSFSDYFTASKFKSWITKISRWWKRHEIFLLMVISIIDFESELRIEKKFANKPVGGNLSTFGTFARTHPITLKLYQNIEEVIFTKNHEKKVGNNYGHFAIIGIWNLKNCQNFNIKEFRDFCSFFLVYTTLK